MNNTTANNDTTLNLTWEPSPSRYHSPEHDARIRAAMEREFQETGGGEYDTDFSDDDELFYEDEEYDTYTKGETKEN